jgi:hypothetical protein
MKVNFRDIFNSIGVEASKNAVIGVFAQAIGSLTGRASEDLAVDGIARELGSFTFEAWRNNNPLQLEECKANIPVLMETYRLDGVHARQEVYETLVNVVGGTLFKIADIASTGLSTIVAEALAKITPPAAPPAG